MIGQKSPQPSEPNERPCTPREQVYVVPRDRLFPRGAPQGFVPGLGEWQRTIYEDGFFAERDLVEEDPSLKQVIPYAIVARGDEVFLFRRLDKGGEKRLAGLRSIGVGGHVNPVDSEDVVIDALKRELEEELHIPSGWRHRIVGLLNDDATSVGSVHVGVVAIVDPGEGEVSVREADTMSGSFVDRRELLALRSHEPESFEGWSRLLVDQIERGLRWDETPALSTTIPNATPTSTT